MIVLAAGASRRMGAENKLLLPFQERTVIEATLRTIIAADSPDVVVVLGHDADRVEEEILDLPVRIVRNPDFRSGMSSSIRAGVLAARGAVGICPADMPLITVGTITRLLDTLAANPQKIVVPVVKGRDGHPVLFAERFRDDLLGLEGDRGARSIIDSCPEAVLRVETNDSGIVRDIDTPDDYYEARTGA